MAHTRGLWRYDPTQKRVVVDLGETLCGVEHSHTTAEVKYMTRWVGAKYSAIYDYLERTDRTMSAASTQLLLAQPGTFMPAATLKVGFCGRLDSSNDLYDEFRGVVSRILAKLNLNVTEKSVLMSVWYDGAGEGRKPNETTDFEIDCARTMVGWDWQRLLELSSQAVRDLNQFDSTYHPPHTVVAVVAILECIWERAEASDYDLEPRDDVRIVIEACQKAMESGAQHGEALKYHSAIQELMSMGKEHYNTTTLLEDVVLGAHILFAVNMLDFTEKIHIQGISMRSEDGISYTDMSNVSLAAVMPLALRRKEGNTLSTTFTSIVIGVVMACVNLLPWENRKYLTLLAIPALVLDAIASLFCDDRNLMSLSMPYPRADRRVRDRGPHAQTLDKFFQVNMANIVPAYVPGAAEDETCLDKLLSEISPSYAHRPELKPVTIFGALYSKSIPLGDLAKHSHDTIEYTVARSEKMRVLNHIRISRTSTQRPSVQTTTRNYIYGRMTVAEMLGLSQWLLHTPFPGTEGRAQSPGGFFKTLAAWTLKFAEKGTFENGDMSIGRKGKECESPAVPGEK